MSCRGASRPCCGTVRSPLRHCAPLPHGATFCCPNSGAARFKRAGAMGGCFSQPEAPRATGEAPMLPPSSSGDPQPSSEERTTTGSPAAPPGQPAGGADAGHSGTLGQVQAQVAASRGGGSGASSVPARTKLQMQLLGDVRGPRGRAGTVSDQSPAAARDNCAGEQPSAQALPSPQPWPPPSPPGSDAARPLPRRRAPTRPMHAAGP